VEIESQYIIKGHEVLKSLQHSNLCESRCNVIAELPSMDNGLTSYPSTDPRTMLIHISTRFQLKLGIIDHALESDFDPVNRYILEHLPSDWIMTYKQNDSFM
jgi:hypothetical protein